MTWQKDIYEKLVQKLFPCLVLSYCVLVARCWFCQVGWAQFLSWFMGQDFLLMEDRTGSVLEDGTWPLPLEKFKGKVLVYPKGRTYIDWRARVAMLQLHGNYCDSVHVCVRVRVCACLCVLIFLRRRVIIFMKFIWVLNQVQTKIH